MKSMGEHEVFSRMSLFLKERSSGPITPLARHSRTPLTLSAERYHKLPEIQFGSVASVDGGQGILFHNGSQAACLLRVAAVCYGPKRLWTQRSTFLAGVRFDGVEHFLIHIEQIDGDPLVFGTLISKRIFMHEKGFMDASGHFDIHLVFTMLRRTLEYLSIQAAAARKVDVILLDGAFDASDASTRHSLQAARDACRSSGSIIAGLSKSCSLLTNSGIPLIQALEECAPMPTWWYDALWDGVSEKTDILFARLHEQSPSSYRLDAVREDIPRLLGLLRPLCNDGVLPGYPYGLIEADALARVSKEELARAKLRMRMDPQGLRIFDAHAILDSIRF